MGSDLVERLEEEAIRLSGRSIDNGCVDSGIASNLAANAAARIAELEAALSAEKAKVAEAVRERDNSRANSVSRGKKLLRLRAKLIQISDNIEYEGDRAYFGSTNDADSLREIFLWLDGFKWDRVMSESDEYDLLSSVERLLARAEAAEAALSAATAKVARYEARLEIDHCFKLVGEDLVREEIPAEERERFPDGILARDETIKLQDRRIEAAEAEAARLERLVRVWQDAFKTGRNEPLEIANSETDRAALEAKP